MTRQPVFRHRSYSAEDVALWFVKFMVLLGLLLALGFSAYGKDHHPRLRVPIPIRAPVANAASHQCRFIARLYSVGLIDLDFAVKAVLREGCGLP